MKIKQRSIKHALNLKMYNKKDGMFKRILKSFIEIIKIILAPKKSIEKSKELRDNKKDDENNKDIYPLW